MTKQRISPVIKPVIESFNRVFWQTTTFANNPGSAMNGLLVLGDAGVGKSHYVKEALRTAGVQKNVEYIKGGTITAASLYVKLYLNRDPHRILVFDDVDLIGHPERNKIVPLILGAVEEGKNRDVEWSTAKKNALMQEFDVPSTFEFNGNIILITNYTHAIIAERMRQWSQAFKSRFNDVECIFTHEQKYLYTKHLLEQEDMLGAKCRVHKYEHKGEKYNGYPQTTIDQTVDFIDDNYMSFSDITPRVAIKVADTIHYYSGVQQKVMLEGLVK